MVCALDIEKFNTYIQKNRVYTFLDGLDDHLDNIRAQVLQMNLFPSLEQAYAHVRRESYRQEIMIKDGQGGIQNSVAMTTRGYKPQEVNSNAIKFSNATDKSKLKCSHCGGTRHIKEQCFELVGYLDWWKDPKKGRPKEGNKGRASIVCNAENKSDPTHQTDSNNSESNQIGAPASAA
jgi:hypothetical protein